MCMKVNNKNKYNQLTSEERDKKGIQKIKLNDEKKVFSMNNAKYMVLIVVFIIYLPVEPLAEIIKEELIATGLKMPVAITHTGDGSGRLFIALQNGQIIIYDGTQVLPTPFLNIESLVSCCGEQGLLSVAFHPNYANNGFFYVNYTNTNGDTVIASYTVSADPNVADPNSSVILLTITQPFSNHNGGQLQFGTDGYLYIGMGDGGSGGDPQNNAQNLEVLLGKMLRIDVDSGIPFTIPPDNPFVGNPSARDEIWAFGLRNPWRFSFDRLTGDLFIPDVGQEDWEEVNFQLSGGSGGENYGWRMMEGNHCFNPTTNCNDGTLTLPILEYDHSLGCSITGGFRYRGNMNLQLSGTYIYGDFCSGRIWGATEDDNGVWTTTELLDTNFDISAFGEDEASEIYFSHYSTSDGAIYRLDATLSDVWVDFTYTGTELGTQAQPYNTLAEAIDAVEAGDEIIIKAGTTSETLTIDKNVTIESSGGTATIGKQ